MVKAVGVRDQMKAVSFRGAKHAMTEGNFRFEVVEESIEACKRLKTGLFSMYSTDGLWQSRCTCGEVANAQLRFSSCLLFPCEVDPLPSGATDRGTGQGWRAGRLTPRLGPRNQSQFQPCIAKKEFCEGAVLGNTECL